MSDIFSGGGDSSGGGGKGSFGGMAPFSGGGGNPLGGLGGGIGNFDPTMFDPTAFMGSYGDPLAQAQTAMTPPGTPVSPQIGGAQNPAAGQQSGTDSSGQVGGGNGWLSKLKSMLSSDTAAQQRPQQANAVPQQQQAPAWMQPQTRHSVPPGQLAFGQPTEGPPRGEPSGSIDPRSPNAIEDPWMTPSTLTPEQGAPVPGQAPGQGQPQEQNVIDPKMAPSSLDPKTGESITVPKQGQPGDQLPPVSDQKAPGATLQPPPAGTPTGTPDGGPGQGRPGQGMPGWQDQGMGQFLQLLTDLLFGGPQKLMQDLLSMAQQAQGMQPAMAGPGGPASYGDPQADRPYTYIDPQTGRPYIDPQTGERIVAPEQAGQNISGNFARNFDPSRGIGPVRPMRPIGQAQNLPLMTGPTGGAQGTEGLRPIGPVQGAPLMTGQAGQARTIPSWRQDMARTGGGGGGRGPGKPGDYNFPRAYDLIKSVGGTDSEARTLAAIAQAESTGNPGAHNPRGKDNSYGLWQINMRGKMGPERLRQFGLSRNEDLYDPKTNARVALQMARQRRGYHDWSTYNTGKHLRHMPRTQMASDDGGT